MNNKSRIKIAVMATPVFVVPVLERILDDERFDLVAIITAPDTKVGRGGRVQTTGVGAWALSKEIPLYKMGRTEEVELVLNGEVLSFMGTMKCREILLRSLNLDLLLVMAYGYLLTEGLLGVARLPAVNLHYSLLPAYRGAAPMQGSILAGAVETGISIQLMSKRLDAGAILARFSLESAGLALGELQSRLTALSVKNLPEILVAYVAGTIQVEEQDESQASFTSKITRVDGEISPQTETAEMIYRKYLAYGEWPGIWIKVQGRILKLTEVGLDMADNSQNSSKSIISQSINDDDNHGINLSGKIVIDSDKQVLITCKTGSIVLKRVQLAGGRELAIADFMRGRTDFIHNILPS